MEEMQEISLTTNIGFIIPMLTAMRDQQSLLLESVNKEREELAKLSIKVENMDRRLIDVDYLAAEAKNKITEMNGLVKKMTSKIEENDYMMDEADGTLTDLNVSVGKLDDKVGELLHEARKFTDYLRWQGWERMRKRRLEWGDIPPLSRKTLIPFLPIEDILNLDSAVTEKKIREELKKSYKGAEIPAFNSHRYTNNKDFKGLRWVIKSKVNLNRCNLILHLPERGLVAEADCVLRWLVLSSHQDLAVVHAQKSDARDSGEDVSTLYEAASRGYVEVVAALAAKGANVSKRANFDGYYTTPLHIASRCGHVGVVKTLLNCGAFQFQSDSFGDLPMHAASNRGHAKVVRELLADDIVVYDVVNKEDMTPLHFAARGNHVEVAKMLLEANADPRKIDTDGRTPQWYAQREKYEEMIQLLQQAIQKKLSMISRTSI